MYTLSPTVYCFLSEYHLNKSFYQKAQNFIIKYLFKQNDLTPSDTLEQRQPQRYFKLYLQRFARILPHSNFWDDNHQFNFCFFDKLLLYFNFTFYCNVFDFIRLFCCFFNCQFKFYFFFIYSI